MYKIHILQHQLIHVPAAAMYSTNTIHMLPGKFGCGHIPISQLYVPTSTSWYPPFIPSPPCSGITCIQWLFIHHIPDSMARQYLRPMKKGYCIVIHIWVDKVNSIPSPQYDILLPLVSFATEWWHHWHTDGLPGCWQCLYRWPTSQAT